MLTWLSFKRNMARSPQFAEIKSPTRPGLNIIALSFLDNPFDGHTLPAVLSQVASIVGKRPTMAICDRGYRGKRIIGATRIEIPESGKGAKNRT